MRQCVKCHPSVKDECHAERMKRLENLALVFREAVRLPTGEFMRFYGIVDSPKDWCLQRIDAALKEASCG